MHVASVMVFEGTAPTLQELVEHIVSRLHLVPRYRQRLAYVPFGQGRPVWADDPHFNPLLPHPPHRAAEAGRRRGAQAARRAPVLAAPRPLQAAVGDLAGAEHVRRALRADRQDPPRAGRRHLRRGHHDRPVRHRARARADARRRSPWSAKPLPGQAKLLGEALIERSTVPAEMARGARALLRAPRQGRLAGQGRARERRRDDARRHQRAGAAEPVQRRDRPAPALHVRRRRPRARSRRSRTRSAARSTTSCSRRSASRSAATCAATEHDTEGSC